MAAAVKLAAMKIDLHTHSTASDGKLSPVALYDRAVAQGVDCLALTDHDTLHGVRQLQHYLAKRDQASSTRLVPGVEVTALAGKLVVHILGLWVDSQSASLESFLESQKQVRLERGRKIGSVLARKGFSGAYEGAEALASGDCLARPHFAQFLVDQGHCSTMAQAFRRYLGNGKVADVKCDWPDMAQAIRAIHCGGGIAVLAHPHKYDLTATKLRSLLDEFVSAKGDGVEVVSGHQKSDSSRYLATLAARRELLCTTGSDFHSPEYYWCELGAQPSLPEGARLAWREAG